MLVRWSEEHDAVRGLPEGTFASVQVRVRQRTRVIHVLVEYYTLSSEAHLEPEGAD